MRGLLITLLMLASTSIVHAQSGSTASSPTQNDSFVPQTNQANQTRLGSLQNGSSIDNDSDKYVIVDDNVDFPSNNSGTNPVFGPENDPRVRNAVREQPRFGAQSSQRSATNVLPQRNANRNGNGFQNDRFSNNRERNNQTSNTRLASNQATSGFSIYDLQITRTLEDELKQKGYLFAPTNVQQAGSDQIRLFSDSQRANNRSNEAKIFSSRVSTYQGNLVIDIDDTDLQRIEAGSYTLDDFDRYDARGVVLRYVSRNNDKVDITRLQLGQTGSNSSASTNNRSREFSNNRSREFSNNRSRDTTNDRLSQRETNFRSNRNDDSRRSDDGYGAWTMPDSRTDDRRVSTNIRDDRRISTNSRDGRYDQSSIQRDYQDRMADNFRDDSFRQRDRLVDRRETSRYEENSRYDDLGYDDRRTTGSSSRDLLEFNDRQRDLDRGFVELSDWQNDLARKTREIEEQRRDLERLNLQASSRDNRFETANSQSGRYGSVDMQRLYDTRIPMGDARYADTRLSMSRDSRLDDYNGRELSDPEFARYEKQNQDQLTRINKKMAAIDQSNKLYALENQLDSDYEKQQLKQAQAKYKNGGTVSSFNDDGLVRSTLGGNLAAGRSGPPGDRFAANFGDAPEGRTRGVADLSLRSNGQGFDTDQRYYRDRGVQNSGGASDKLVRALWFIALLSIGMNLYLALLARSFYSRYNELADELRETFTASI